MLASFDFLSSDNLSTNTFLISESEKLSWQKIALTCYEFFLQGAWYISSGHVRWTMGSGPHFHQLVNTTYWHFLVYFWNSNQCQWCFQLLFSFPLLTHPSSEQLFYLCQFSHPGREKLGLQLSTVASQYVSSVHHLLPCSNRESSLRILWRKWRRCYDLFLDVSPSLMWSWGSGH